MGFFDRFRNPATTLVQSPVSPDLDAVTPVATLEGGRRYQLNTVGQVCPFPLVEAKQAIKQLEPGDELVIDFDCTQATDSIPHWAAAAGYPVTNFEQVGDASWTITVQKA
ncbi:sulfurtransferase TusA family protein [Propioniciclava sp. MC1595]|uniref:sulfurtransferase TusA family protein n=1 Tax=Propioniciclava sp. MC1595 TaxID=2760308 RepID=UPI0016625D85|nr:sulfurtransferase TusA family protein [Propioniciclava sp. MC1595]MBB1494749.1 sulfurtransferase TusA family protein [Propioniciclava sp. MC1595]QTE25821.1 sulfurtransferase TusA family protein [Propioniciclava sp. MC1595]